MKFALLLGIGLLLVALVQAHGEAKVQDVEGYRMHLQTDPPVILEGEPVVLEVHVEDGNGNPVSGSGEIEVLREHFPVEAAEPGVYRLTYTFERFGANEAVFTIDGLVGVFPVDVEIGETSTTSGIIALIIIALIVIGFGAGVVTKKMKITSALLYGGITVVVFGLGYSVFAYKQSPAVQGCLLQVGDQYVIHCHQNIHLMICGEDRGFGWEEGSLDSAHTHKGDHRIHWHPGAPVDDPDALQTLRNMFVDLGFELTEESVEDPATKQVYRVGEDGCDSGTGGVLTAYVTPEHSSERAEMPNFLDYSLPDEARIDIEYT